MKTPKKLAADKIKQGLKEKHAIMDDKIRRIEHMKRQEEDRQSKLMEEEKVTYDVLRRFRDNPNGQLHIVQGDLT